MRFRRTFSEVIDPHSAIAFFALDKDVIVKRGEDGLEHVDWLERERRLQPQTGRSFMAITRHFQYGQHGSEERMIDLVPTS